MRQTCSLDFHSLPLSRHDRRDLRSDHAGEHGAVAIYRGMLAVTRDPSLRRFARRHLLSESRHLRFFERFLPGNCKSRLLPLWWLSGWLLGAGSALVGPRAAYATVAAVESFVEDHYREQIESMQPRPGLSGLIRVLEQFCVDEVHHRNDALGQVEAGNASGQDWWSAVVGGGSRIGVAIARRI